MELSKAKLTFSLKKKNMYVSSYNGFFVLGYVPNLIYTVYVKFYSFEIEIFYNHLRLMIEFLTNNESKLTESLIKQNKTKYIYHGYEKENIKLVEVVIQISLNNSQIIIIDEDCTENILHSLPQIYVSSLNLNESLKFCFFDLCKENESVLLQFKTDLNAFNVFFKKLKVYFNHADLFDCFQLLSLYFNEICIISQIIEYKN